MFVYFLYYRVSRGQKLCVRICNYIDLNFLFAKKVIAERYQGVLASIANIFVIQYFFFLILNPEHKATSCLFIVQYIHYILHLVFSNILYFIFYILDFYYSTSHPLLLWKTIQFTPYKNLFIYTILELWKS